MLGFNFPSKMCVKIKMFSKTVSNIKKVILAVTRNYLDMKWNILRIFLFPTRKEVWIQYFLPINHNLHIANNIYWKYIYKHIIFNSSSVYTICFLNIQQEYHWNTEVQHWYEFCTLSLILLFLFFCENIAICFNV